ncbi:hypothetical protein F66182_4517 [Fusarium sp. NRRL 66182]|nr:hypothetical protein F66182_4517 [Fusarium sp. NRRL 66182]
MSKSQRTVLISGGGIAGLTLANMLESFGQKYIILEAHGEIAPQVGASIGLHPNGLRILDQIGCADEIVAQIETPQQDEAWMRGSDGSVINHYPGARDSRRVRHGYPTTFIDRQAVLKILYENLESKDAVLCNQRVVSVKALEDGVEVTTSKGETYRGDILIGADGLHSTVRKEMWRIAHELSPGYFAADEWSTVPCHYKCMFGISHPIEALPKGAHYVLHQGSSYLILDGPGGRVYWFLFVKLPCPLYGEQIPRYTKQDEADIAEEYASQHITPDLRFGQLYESRMTATLTPLHEHVFQKWHFGRMMTVGDASHKFNPLTGRGGNGAIETAACLINHLFSGKNKNWTNSEIDAVFRATQDDRHDRASWLMANSHATQRVHAMETPLHAALAKIMPRLTSADAAFNTGGLPNLGASRVDGLPIIKREHLLPYDDELPAKPLPHKWVITGLGVLAQASLYQLSQKLLSGLSPFPTTFGDAPLADHYTGIGAVDKTLKVLVSVFGVPLAGQNQAQWTQLVAFTPLILSTTLDWTIEAHRTASEGLVTSLPSLFGSAFQLRGIGRIAPLYHLVSVLEHALCGFVGRVGGHAIPNEVADAVLPSLGLGYVLPTALMLWPFKNSDTRQKLTAFWQPFPVYVSLLVGGISSVYRRQKTTVTGEQSKAKSKQKLRHDKATQSTLRLIYTAGAAASGLVHLWSVYRILSNPDMSFSTVFGKLGFLISGRRAPTMEGNIFTFFQRDMLLNAASVLAHTVFRIVHLRSLGYITTKQAVRASVATLVAQPIVGPSAAHIGFLGWREEVFNKVQRRISTEH